jgi:group I intron endonuclease
MEETNLMWPLNKMSPRQSFAGVYKIYNIITGGFYIGSTINFHKRFYDHRKDLRRQKHTNRHLQNAYNKYGEENFVFEILLWCDAKDKDFWENKLIEIQNPTYNIRLHADTNVGTKRTPETCARISASLKGKKASEESRLINSIAHTGLKESEEQKQKIGLAHKGMTWAAKTYQICLIAPDGVIYKNITNAAKFARDHDLNVGVFNTLCHGLILQHKGWKLYKEGEV